MVTFSCTQSENWQSCKKSSKIGNWTRMGNRTPCLFGPFFEEIWTRPHIQPIVFSLNLNIGKIVMHSNRKLTVKNRVIEPGVNRTRTKNCKIVRELNPEHGTSMTTTLPATLFVLTCTHNTQVERNTLLHELSLCLAGNTKRVFWFPGFLWFVGNYM